MGEGPVRVPSGKPPSWRLKTPDDAKTQGIVVSGFSDVPWAEALFLYAAHDGAAWIHPLRSAAPITDAAGKEKQARAAALAFTCGGLAKLGLPGQVLGTFSAPFLEGMYQEDRLRRLGDKVDGVWQATVIGGGPIWGGNTPAPNDRLDTPQTVHALLLLYDSSQAGARSWADEVKRTLAPFEVTVVRQLSLDLRLDANGIGREHFGFADGLSQPIPYGEAVVLSDGRPSERDPWHGVPLGEILLSHNNAHHERAPGPMVEDDPAGRGRERGLNAAGAPQGYLNLGLNGSYMVVRELRQDVAAFWQSVDDGAARIRAHDPGATEVTAQWLAERIIGRNADGHLLRPGGFLPAGENNQPQNAFGFIRTDPYGDGCPLGSHVRRANPRDGLAPDRAAAQTLLDAANNHRILRRGRKYGTTIENPHVDDGQERGLLFICLNTDIERQFEFVQKTWVLNQNFATLFDETDPLVGPKGNFTIPQQPLRHIVEVETFIRMAGGEYFFLPSIPALDYLAAL
jgi:deferrochelatase/peroxidase EfeB